MKKNMIHIVTSSFIVFLLTACGGGGGSTPPVPTTKVVMSAYLFGTMTSSTATVSSIHASMKVPSLIFADYSSPAPSGYPTNVFPVRSRSIKTSGVLLNSSATISGTYNTRTGFVELSLMNNPAPNNTIASLRSSIAENGNEFAKLYFNLATADSNVPFQASSQSLSYDIKQTDLATQTSGDRAKGCELKFSTTYQ